MPKFNKEDFCHYSVVFLLCCGAIAILASGIHFMQMNAQATRANHEAYMKGMDIIQIQIEMNNRFDIETWIRKEEAENFMKLLAENKGAAIFLKTKGHNGYGDNGVWIDTGHVVSAKIKE